MGCGADAGGHRLASVALIVGGGGWRALDEFDLISLRRIDESEPAGTVGLVVGTVGVGKAEAAKVLGEVGEAFDLEGEVGQVGLDVDRTAGRKGAQFDGFLAFRGLEEDEF